MKIIAANSRASHDYTFNAKIDSGLVLTGSEVKSLRLNTGSIRGSYIQEKDGGLWLSNCFIKKYNNANDINYNPNRDRKILIKKREYLKILGLLKQGGCTIVPITLYFNDKGIAKLTFGVGKGKKKYDKRQTIKDKDWNIKKARILKNN